MPAPGVRHGPVFSEAMEIPFNQPHQHGPELDYIRDAILRAHLCGDGYYTKKCHELLAERTGSGKVLLVHSGTAALEMAALLIDCRRRRDYHAFLYVRFHGERVCAARRRSCIRGYQAGYAEY